MKLESVFDRFRHVGMRELAIMSRQFATLIGSGMPMLRTLYTLEDQTEDETIKSALGGMRQDVEAGSSLADAMERRPDVFNTLFRSMVRSGESSGRLEEALERIAFHFEKLDALRRQIRSAMMYPMFVMVLAFIDHDRRRRVHRPGLHRRVRGDRLRAAGRVRGPAPADADHRRGLRLRHGLLVHLDPRA